MESALNKFKERKEKDKLRLGISAQVNVGHYFMNSNLATKEMTEDLMQKEKDLKNA